MTIEQIIPDLKAQFPNQQAEYVDVFIPSVCLSLVLLTRYRTYSFPPIMSLATALTYRSLK